MHLYQLCYNARRMDRHSEAELWARFKAAGPRTLQYRGEAP